MDNKYLKSMNVEYIDSSKIYQKIERNDRKSFVVSPLNINEFLELLKDTKQSRFKRFICEKCGKFNCICKSE
jgi:hypothetical protein